MGLFGVGFRDVRRALRQVVPGSTWQVECFANDPRIGIWFVALPSAGRPGTPPMSVDQARIIAPDIWDNLAALRSRITSISVWLQTDDGHWVGYSPQEPPQVEVRERIPACFT